MTEEWVWHEWPWTKVWVAFIAWTVGSVLALVIILAIVGFVATYVS